MNANEIIKLINSLGADHSHLVENNIIPGSELKKIYEDEHTLSLDIDNSVELIFGSEFFLLEEINISVTDGATVSPKTLFDIKNLPFPYAGLNSKSQVFQSLGMPFSSSDPFMVTGTLQRVGSTDRYQIVAELYPNGWIEFHYNRDLEVERVQFSVMERE